MKRFVLAVLMGLSLYAPSFAHDEGHGPMLTDQGRQGGVMAPVIDQKDSTKGSKATVVYKAELVRSEDGTVRVYLYDKEMTPLDLAKFEPPAKGVVETEKKHKVTKTPFSLQLKDGAFVGMAPKPAVKPFNIDVKLKEAGRELLTAFDNLD